MNDIRSKFEEIWPVPEWLHWSNARGMYLALGHEYVHAAANYNARLDTFTRCQESIFSKEELNLFRQWFNAVEDLNPTYLEKSDCDLYRKVMELLK